jgi:hypothetical protein
MRDDSDLQAIDLARFGVHAVQARHLLCLSRAALARLTGLSEDKLRRLELCDGSITLRDAGTVQRTLDHLLEERAHTVASALGASPPHRCRGGL